MGIAKATEKKKNVVIPNKKAKKLQAEILKFKATGGDAKPGTTQNKKHKKTIKKQGASTPNKNAPKVIPQKKKLQKKISKKDKTVTKQVNKNAAKKDAEQPSTVISDEEKKALNAQKEKRTVFVGNLELNTKKKQVQKFFSSCGEVESVRLRTCDGEKITKTRKENGSLIAYVVFRDNDSVKEALKLTGMEFKGRHIRVDTAVKAEKQVDDADSKKIIFVGNLKYSATDEKLYELFSSCGEVEYVRTIQCKKGCKGVAFVCFRKPESVGLALELNKTLMDDRPIHVEHYSTKKLKESTKSSSSSTTKHSSQVKQRLKVKGVKTKSKQKSLPENQKVKSKNPVKAKGNEESKLPRKKSEFRGVQTASKKKSKSKKSKGNSMLKLANKIAPRQ